MKTLLRSLPLILTGLLGLALIAWVIRGLDVAAVGRALAQADYLVLSLTLPLIVGNLIVRAGRWQQLLVTDRPPRLGAFFSALSVGYLTNNLLPARGGDLVRVYMLGNGAKIRKSLVLATLLLERVLDLAGACLLLGLAALLFVLPVWLRDGGLAIGTGACAGLALLLWMSIAKTGLTKAVLDRLAFFPDWIHSRIQVVLEGFLDGTDGLRSVRKSAAFLFMTALLWISEIAIAWIVAGAFHLDLTLGEAWIVMLFVVFGSLIPALPGQLGTFEFAAVTGLAALGHSGEIVLAFALGWHVSLLSITSAIGAICLAVQGQSLVPLRVAAKSADGPAVGSQGT